ncbi:VOC family protein [Celeribacter sp.]|uniref:VOC family protein n=1 Tax=Celeribacter sp. TaxID=1890673 RepID=UPI003A94D450
MHCALDHLVISATDLETGRLWAQNLLDIPFGPRGVHTCMGTHNHLTALDRGAYLEVIAVDAQAIAPAHPRWFDLDNFSGAPRLSNWVLNVDDLDAALAAAPAGAGQVVAFERGAYRWKMAVPETGVLPFDGCFPALIEWQSAHPAPALDYHGLALRRLKLSHPQSDALTAALEPFAAAMESVRIVNARTPSLHAEIGTPSGEIWIT